MTFESIFTGTVLSLSPEAVMKKTPEHQPDPATWVDDYGDYLYRFALSRVSDPALAKDLVQDTLLAGLRSLDRFRGEASVKTWLSGIMKNKVIDHYRKSGREVLLEDLGRADDDAGGFNPLNGHWLVSDQTSPREWHEEQAAHMDRDEFWRVFQACASHLSETARQVFIMRELEGMSGDEICKSLDISSQNFWVIMHRSRASLRRCLEVNWFTRTA